MIFFSFTIHDSFVSWCLDTDLLCHLYDDLTGPRVKLRLSVRALFLYCIHNISMGHWLPLIKSVNLQNKVKTKTSKLSFLSKMLCIAFIFLGEILYLLCFVTCVMIGYIFIHVPVHVLKKFLYKSCHFLI